MEPAPRAPRSASTTGTRCGSGSWSRRAGAYWKDCAADQLVRRAETGGANAARPRLLGPGGHLRPPGGLRGARGPRPGRRRNLFAAGRGTTAALRRRQSPRLAQVRRGQRGALPRGGARRRSCEVPKGEDVPAPAPVTVFETEQNRWRRFDRWPPAVEARRLYLPPGGRLALTRPPQGGGQRDRVRLGSCEAGAYSPPPQGDSTTINPTVSPPGGAGSSRTSASSTAAPTSPLVVEPLTEPLTIGAQIARLFAETTGSDADWVVELIDVFPDDAPKGFEITG